MIKLSNFEIECKLKEFGINSTAQRIAICQFVLGGGHHPTAEQVKDWVDENFPKISLATVYNTLNSLVDVGLLRELKFPHSDKSFFDHNLEEHYHFFDEVKQELCDIEVGAIQLDSTLLERYDVDRADIILYGKKVT